MADVVVGAKLSLDGSDGIKTMRDFKAQIKEAKGDLVAMTEQFGLTSNEAREAARRVAELEDNLGDAKNLVDSFNPDKKFVALGQALNGVLGGFTALTGAMGLLGVESEEVQKQLLKVQSAMALSQGLNQIGDSIQSFKNLGKTLVETLGKNGLIGLAIAGVTALGLAIAGVFDRKKDEAIKALNSSIKDFTKASGDARASVSTMSQELKLAKEGYLSKDEVLKKFNQTFGETLGTANSINDAERILNQNAEAFIRNTGLKAQAQALYAKAAQDTAEILVKQQAIQEADIPTNIKEAALKKLGDQLASADRINKMADDLLRKSVQVGGSLTGLGGSVGANTKSTKGTATTPAGALKEKELQEVDYYESLFARMERDRQAEKDRLRSMNEAGEAASLSTRLTNLGNFEQSRTEIEKNNAEARIIFAEQERQARVQAAMAVGNALGALSDLVGKQTAAGKVLGIAQATINTFIGATEVLRAKSVLPEPFGTIAKIANVAAIIASGLAAVKNIVKVQVPGYAASGGNAGQLQQVAAPLQAQTPLASRTRLEQDQINQIGNATVRAFVVESDVTNNQERIRRLNRAARI